MALPVLNIPKKIFLSLIVMLLLMAALTWGSILEVQRLNQDLSQINEVNSVKQRYAINFRGSVHDRAIAIRDVILLDNETARREVVKLIERLAADYAENEKLMEAMIDSPVGASAEELKILEEIAAIQEKTNPLVERIIFLQNNGRPETATYLLTEQASPLFSEWLATINRFIDHQEYLNAEVNETVQETVSGFRTVSLTLLAVAVLMALVSSYFTSRSITVPLSRILSVMRSLADGNTDVAVPYETRRDEIGNIAKTVSVFKENAQEIRRMEQAAEQAKVQAEKERRAAMDRLADDFDTRTSSIIDSLFKAARQMQETAEKVAKSSGLTSDISGNVANAAMQADANVQTVASATEELTASAREISSQIGRVASMAAHASKEAETIGSEVRNLREMSTSIGEVVGAIKEIADQTNLLALNATIEAARAGEAGKGFAVVADEVKKLANETARKTEEIDERVTRIQEAISSSATAMDKITNNVKDIDEATTSVSAAVEQQNAATDEIGRNVTEASVGTQQVSSSIVNVQNNAYETGEASKTVLQAADDLANLSETLRTQVTTFLSEIRSGEERNAKDAHDEVQLAQDAQEEQADLKAAA